MADSASLTPELVFLPLGGCNEIGMNLNAYGFGPPHARRWIIVDTGVTFGGLSEPGIDLITADPAYLTGETIEAIFLTHAHEDHIGAIGLIYPQLNTRAPIYATPFTAELARQKLAERGVDSRCLKVISQGARITAGPFSIQYITLTHSIPEPNAMAIETPLGVVLHTGDWKIDPSPQIGSTTDVKSLTELGERGVLAMVCDSTNVFEDGEAGSEDTVRQGLADLIAEQKGAVAVTTFASNVARLKSVIEAAVRAERSVVLVGRSMHRIIQAAQATGILPNNLDLVDEAEAGSYPPAHVLYLCTGSQGEPQAALSRIARGDHRHVRLEEGDTVVFSSRLIPGNEAAVHQLQNTLAEQGVNVITPSMVPQVIHVSGHPCRDELRRMYQWIRPQIAVPVHGERRHLLEHAAYAKLLQVPQAIAARNGSLIRLAPGPAEIIDEVPAGRVYLDGGRLIPAGAEGLRERSRLAAAGIIYASLAVGARAELVDGPVIVVKGLSENDGRSADESIERLELAAEAAFNGIKRQDRMDDDTIERIVGRALRKACDEAFGLRPMIEVVILRG